MIRDFHREMILLHPLRIIAVGEGLGVVFPPNLLERLGLVEGNYLFVQERDGAVVLAKADPQFERTMEVAREVMSRRDNVLRQLPD